MLDGDPDEFDAEDLDRIRAHKMLPRWGQFAAWIAWQLPWSVFFFFTAGPLWIFFEWALWWKIALAVFVLLTVLLHTARKQPNPFKRFVIVTRKPIPGELVDRARAGAAPPEEVR